jgi:hypothetical protein
MATETQRPDAQLSCSNLVTCDVLEHDEDPDVSSVTIAATGNNVNTEYGVDFPTPTGNPTVGAGLQEFRAGVEEFDSGQTGTPQARIELWENGSLIRAGTDTDVSTYAVLSFTWNANELGTADGSLVQCKVIGSKSGGAPGARNTVDIGHIEWNVTYDAASTYYQSVDGGLTFIGLVVKKTNKFPAGALTFVGDLSYLPKKILTGGLTFVGNLARKISIFPVGGLTFSGDLTKKTSKFSIGGLTFTGILTTATIFQQALAGALTFVGDLSLLTGKTLSGVLTFTGNLSRKTSKFVSGSLTFAGELSKKMWLSLLGAITFVGNLTTDKIVGGPTGLASYIALWIRRR